MLVCRSGHRFLLLACWLIFNTPRCGRLQAFYPMRVSGMLLGEAHPAGVALGHWLFR